VKKETKIENRPKDKRDKLDETYIIYPPAQLHEYSKLDC